MDMAPPNKRMMFQGMVSMSSTSRVRVRKKSTVATIMMAARSMSLKKGMGEKDFIMNRPRTTITMAMTNFSFLFMGPSSLPRVATRSRKPSILLLPGLKHKLTVSQMKNTMITPRGSMYQVREKKPISVPPVNFWNMPAPATARAEPRKVMMDPAPAVQAMPMNRPLPNLGGWRDS